MQEEMELLTMAKGRETGCDSDDGVGFSRVSPGRPDLTW